MNAERKWTRAAASAPLEAERNIRARLMARLGGVT